MRYRSLAVALLVAASGARAQLPGAPGAPTAPGGAPPVPPEPPGIGAEFLLAHTGELQLTDAQVVRLAAISRRGAERRRTMRPSMDSLFMRMGARPGAVPSDSVVAASRRALAARYQQVQQLRGEEHADLREAIQVLTADQQARAWELRAIDEPGPRDAVGRQAGYMRVGPWGPPRDDGRAPRRDGTGGQRPPER